MKEKIIFILLIPFIFVAVLIEDLFEGPDEDGNWEVPQKNEEAK